MPRGLALGEQTLLGNLNCGNSCKFHRRCSTWREHGFCAGEGWAEAHVGMDGNSFSVPGQILQEKLHVCWVTTHTEPGRLSSWIGWKFVLKAREGSHQSHQTAFVHIFGLADPHSLFCFHDFQRRIRGRRVFSFYYGNLNQGIQLASQRRLSL